MISSFSMPIKGRCPEIAGSRGHGILFVVLWAGSAEHFPPLFILARHVLFANQWVFRVEVWLLPSLISVCPICFVLTILSLTLYHCLWLLVFCWLISLSIVDIFRRSCWIINHEAQPTLFQFCRHVESMTDYHEVIHLDPRLRAMKFCFHFCYFSESFLHKNVSHWPWKTIYLRQ